MTINRSALKRNSAQALLKKVQEASTKKQESGSGQDTRQWQPTVDSNGNGFAIIRFLPAKTEESLPFVKLYNHGFKVGTKWFIEDCPTTIGNECPVCAANSELWNSGFEKDKDVARQRKRKLRYMSNIIVIKDPKNPENEGKIFLFSYGQKIFDKLTTAMNPPEEYGESPRDPYGFFEGCVTKLKIKQKDGFRNYDDTTVEPASDLYEGDEEQLMAVLEKMYDLGEFTDAKRFKSNEDIKKNFDRVVGNVAAAARAESKPEEPEGTDGFSSGSEYGSGAKETAADKPSAPAEDDDDDDLAFFKKMAEE
jgi:hypothetical protein